MKKEYPESVAQILFKDKKILTNRPPEMNLTEYKVIRRYQTQVLKVMFPKPSNGKILAAMGVRKSYNTK